MTPADLQSALNELGWSRLELGRKLGVHRNTVTGWNYKVPKYVAAYVGLCVKVKRICRGL